MYCTHNPQIFPHILIKSGFIINNPCALTHKTSPFYLGIINRSVWGRNIFPILWFPWWYIFPKASWHQVVLTSSLLVEEWLIWLVNSGKIAFLFCSWSPFWFSESKLPTRSRILLNSSRSQSPLGSTILPRLWAGGGVGPSQAASPVTERSNLLSLNPVSKSVRLSHQATASIWFPSLTDNILSSFSHDFVLVLLHSE